MICRRRGQSQGTGAARVNGGHVSAPAHAASTADGAARRWASKPSDAQPSTPQRRGGTLPAKSVTIHDQMPLASVDFELSQIRRCGGAADGLHVPLL